MQPNEQLQHPIDYLDSIATVPKGAKKGPSDLFFFGAIIAALLVIAVVGLIVFLSGGDTKANLSTLSVRLTNLQTIADDSRKNAVSSRLRATNSSLALVLTNTNRDISDQLTESGIEPKKIDSKITAVEKESTDKLAERLEDARLNGIFDRIYAREMTYELETLVVLIEQLSSETKSSSQKELLSNTLNNIKPLQESFAKFDSTTK